MFLMRLSEAFIMRTVPDHFHKMHLWLCCIALLFALHIQSSEVFSNEAEGKECITCI